MLADDRLPPEARRALASAVEDWVPQPLLTKYRRGTTAADIAAFVALWDRQELAKRERQRAGAIGPYSGNRSEVKDA